MKHFLLHDDSGTIIQWGRADDIAAQVRPGLVALEISADQYANIDPVHMEVHAGVLRQRETPDTAPAWARVRARRNALLQTSDWVRLRANDQGSLMPTDWLNYRQALRDITEQANPLRNQLADTPDKLKRVRLTAALSGIA